MQILTHARNASWLAAERALRILISIFMLGYIARHLGPAQFGLLNYIIAIVTLTIPLVQMGISQVLVRDLVKSEQSGEILATALLMKLAAAVLSIALIGLYAFYFGLGPVQARWLLIIAAAGNLFIAFEVFEHFFLSRETPKYNAISRAGAFLASSALRFVLVLGGAQVAWFAFAYALEWMLIALLVVAFYLASAGRVGPWRFSWQRAGGLFRQCWPEIIAGVAYVVCVRLDQIMLEALTTLEVVGTYTAGSRLSDLWYFVPLALANVVLPAIVNSREKAPAEFEGELQKLLLVLVTIAYVIAVGSVLFAPLLVAVVFGPEFDNAVPVLRLHVWSLVAFALGAGSNAWIVAEGRLILSMYRMLAGAIANALLNALLIPVLGAQGAALATVISLFLAYYLFDLLLPSTRPMFRMKTRALLLLGLAAYLRELRARLQANGPGPGKD